MIGQTNARIINGGGSVKTLNAKTTGTPTISSDFILSDTDDNNYIYAPTLTNASYIVGKIKLTTKFRISDLTKAVDIFGCSPDAQGIRLSYGKEAGQYGLTILVTNGSGSWANTGSYTISNAYTVANQWMWVRITIDTTNGLQVFSSTDGETFSLIHSVSPGTISVLTIGNLQKEIIGGGDASNTLEVDLNEVKYEVDDIVMYEAVR